MVAVVELRETSRDQRAIMCGARRSSSIREKPGYLSNARRARGSPSVIALPGRIPVVQRRAGCTPSTRCGDRTGSLAAGHKGRETPCGPPPPRHVRIRRPTRAASTRSRRHASPSRGRAAPLPSSECRSHARKSRTEGWSEGTTSCGSWLRKPPHRPHRAAPPVGSTRIRALSAIHRLRRRGLVHRCPATGASLRRSVSTSVGSGISVWWQGS